MCIHLHGEHIKKVKQQKKSQSMILLINEAKQNFNLHPCITKTIKILLQVVLVFKGITKV